MATARKTVTAFVCMVALVFGMLAIATHEAYAQDADGFQSSMAPAKQVKGKNISSKGSMNNLWNIDLSWLSKRVNSKKVTKKYDVTQDGKADKLELRLQGLSWYSQSEDDGEGGSSQTIYIGEFSGVKVLVNGKSAGVIRMADVTRDKVSKGEYLKVRLVTLKDKTTFILADDGYYTYGALYQVVNGKLKKGMKLQPFVKAAKKAMGIPFVWPVNIAVKGNTLNVTHYVETKYLGAAEFALKYSLKGGKWVVHSGKPVSWGYYQSKEKPGKYACPARESFKAYSDRTLKKASPTVKKGQKVKAVAAVIEKGQLYLKVKSGGKSGWVKDGVLPIPSGELSPADDSPVFGKCAPGPCE